MFFFILGKKLGVILLFRGEREKGVAHALCGSVKRMVAHVVYFGRIRKARD